MYIESKSGGLTGPARIGRVTFSKTGATLYYRGRAFQRDSGGFKSNWFDVETREPYWISGPHKDGRDALYATHVLPEVDADVHVEYWSKIRGLPVPPRRDGADDACADAGSTPAALHTHFNAPR
ncbi:MAG TPA: 1-deoxy-D-xylulose-5-phosphate synthase [Burkholderiaceae bacterium]